MTLLEFQKVLIARQDHLTAILSKKASEYSRNTDRLSNFKHAAAFERCTPEKAWLGKWSKHVVCIVDMIHDLDTHKENSYELWNEKIGDAMAYLVLLDGLIQERE